jgi:DNA-binding NtrC family response regulator/tetratricopeptide (TPR) repeat protein
MDRLAKVRELSESGYFAEGLRFLSGISPGTAEAITANVLRSELLERMGNYGQSRAIAENLLRSSKLTSSQRCRCELVLGLISLQRSTREASAYFQKAITTARHCGDAETLCWALLRSIFAIVDMSGVDAANSAIRELRKEAVKLGNATVLAALHVFVGQMEAKRGLLQNALKHARIGENLLIGSPNVWLETMAENTFLCISILQSDYTTALRHAEHALDLAERCGGVGVRAMTITNYGNLLNVIGRFDDAIEQHRKALEIVPIGSEYAGAALESIARTKLTLGQLDECAHLLDEIASSFEPGCDRLNYVHRYTELTRAEVLARSGDKSSSIAKLDDVLKLATESNDQLLLLNARILMADVLSAGQCQEAAELLEEVVSDAHNAPPEILGKYEQTLARVLWRLDQHDAACKHLGRAKRIYDATANAPSLIELARIAAPMGDCCNDVGSAEARISLGARDIIHDVAHALTFSSRPELVGRQLLNILWNMRVVDYAELRSESQNGPSITLASCGSHVTVDSQSNSRQLLVGNRSGDKIELLCYVKHDADAISSFNSVSLILSATRELEKGRSEQESRITLWPTEEEPLEEDGFVLVGQMRELMTSTRRVARANVLVLITGESGTGKEVLARAVHRYSDRAAKPFVPFNCAAIPRDLVESHLFGHRRGAFTGADRDNPGIIRSARGGTIFLDEVGELPLDLQPKLLRFLESGEIAPLGEGAPSTVDVRVVAATNAKLEHAVAAGRFREDLFYRLNVIRLEIPPLRERRDEIALLVDHFLTAAAREFKKGRVRVAEETMEHLLVYRWPGNVRQLQNEIRRMAALAEADSVIPPTTLAPEIVNRGLLAQPTIHPGEIAVPVRDKLLPTLARVEREMIKAALRDHGGRVEPAARALGISRKGLYLKRQRLGL